MSKKTVIYVYLLVLSSVLSLTSCGEKDKDKLGDAQSCLDKALPSEAKNCVAKIQDNQSEGANTLRCAAYFIAEGFDQPEKYVDALSQIKKQPTGCSSCSSTMGVVDVLSFAGAGTATTDAIDTNLVNSEQALEYCSNSGNKSYTLIATLARFSTIISMTYAKLSNTNIEDAITSILNGDGTASAADLGAIVSATHIVTCSDTQSADSSTKTICAELSTALDAGSGSNEDVGNCLLEKWKNKNYVCP